MRNCDNFLAGAAKPLAVTLCAAVAAFAGLPCAAQPGPAAPKMGVVRIMSYNVHHCEGADNKVDVKRVAARIKAENPDFACINEIRPAQALELGKETGLHATPCGMGSFNAILSRKPPTRTEEVALKWKKYGPRSLMVCEYPEFAVGVMHFEYGPQVLKYRMESAAIACNMLKKYDKPVFLAGDWNSEPQSEPIAMLRKCVKILSNEHVRTWHGFGLHKTMQPGKKEYCIDYIAVNSRFADRVSVIETHLTKDDEASDHYPVVATLRLNPAGN